ncbi:MAG TPA: hypothetical protein VL181_00330 [Holophagaceae bacterium]|nr:hypothetical protein [Holophagaceae bacterium]
MRNPLPRLPLLLLALAASPVFACGACGCTLNSDWSAQGYASGAGFRLDLRFDYFDQDQLRTGLGRVDLSKLTFPGSQEVQRQTINRNTTLTLDWSPNANWGLTLMAPAFVRTHETIAEGDTAESGSRSAGLGDLRLLGRYQGFSDDHSSGIQFGVKLPTGRTGDTFSSGPQAGELVDRGLQLGTGSTDLIFGVYKFGEMTMDWGYFAQASAQVAVSHSSGYRPGNGLNVNAGVRYAGWRSVTPALQINVRAEKPETGSEADTANSGATLAYLSPGVTVHLGNQFHIYAFVQVPIYQHVTGLQIEPRFLASVGVHYTF